MSIIADDSDFKHEKSTRNPVIKAETIEFDKNFENCIRPKTFDAYIGQTALKDTLKITIEAAKKRGQPLDHLLFYGPPGLGKTTIAGVIAEQMGVDIKITSAPALERPRDIIGILMSLKGGEILFIESQNRKSFGFCRIFGMQQRIRRQNDKRENREQFFGAFEPLSHRIRKENA